VAAKDLRLEWRTWETLSSTLIFSLTVLVVFQFAFGLGTVREVGVERLVPGIVWTVVAFASVVGMVRSLQLERPRDTLGALFLAPVDRGAVYGGKMLANLVKLVILEVYGGKMLANLVKLVILEAFLLPMTAVLFSYDLIPILAPLTLVLLVHGLGLTELGTLFAGVTTRLGRGEALLAVLLFPAASPLLISAVKCTGTVMEGSPLSDVSHWFMISVGLDLLYLMVALMTFEFVLEE
jgi:heme exporter protein B